MTEESMAEQPRRNGAIRMADIPADVLKSQLPD